MSKDTSPVFGNMPRSRKMVTIKQVNEFAPSLDATAIYPSDELPEWFAPLQAIIEEWGFREMVITRGSEDGSGGKVKYHIMAKREREK